MKQWRKILISLLAGIFLFSVVMMIRQQFHYQKIMADGEEVKQIAGLEENKTPGAYHPKTPAEPEGTEAIPIFTENPKEEMECLPDDLADLAAIDLLELRNFNTDVVGWISIPDTKISYPLMQGEDNQYYLSHNWKDESSGGGSVFLESTNDKELTDFHTIAYGHRMGNDTMFGSLKYYRDWSYWREHPNVYVVLDDVIYCYSIFSAHEASVKGIVYRLDMQENQLEEEFLQHCLESSVISTDLTPKPDDRILTLSTCTGNGYANRWVVHGVLTHKYTREQAQIDE